MEGVDGLNAAEYAGKDERFFENGFEKAYTVVFFVDRARDMIGMLRRDDSLSFAPGMYTGVGGKIEKDKNEGHYTGAVRELGEELVEDSGGFGKESIREFGRLIINGRSILSYFILPYEEELPETAKDIGQMSWVPFNDLLNLDIIPTTKVFVSEWQKRGFSDKEPFTVHLTREDLEDINSKILSVEVQEGLQSEPRQ